MTGQQNQVSPLGLENTQTVPPNQFQVDVPKPERRTSAQNGLGNGMAIALISRVAEWGRHGMVDGTNASGAMDVGATQAGAGAE